MGATPKEVLAGIGGGKNPLGFAMQGLAVRKSVAVWDGFVQTLVKMLTGEEGEEPNPMLMKILMPMIPAYLMQFRGTLDIDIDEEAVQEIWETVKQMAPPQAQELIDGDNSGALNALTFAAGGPENPGVFANKSNVDMVNMEDGPWSFMEGHKDVKSEEDAIKLFTAKIESLGNSVLNGERPDFPKPAKKEMFGCLAHFISMIFGDEVSFEGFACVLSAEDAFSGVTDWDKSAGIPVSVKGALRMEGASEIIRLMACNGFQMI